MTGPEQIAALNALLDSAEKVDIWLKTHPFIVTLIKGTLNGLSTLKIGWAIDLKTIFDEVPNTLLEAEKYLPDAIFLLKEIQPVGTGIVGG